MPCEIRNFGKERVKNFSLQNVFFRNVKYLYLKDIGRAQVNSGLIQLSFLKGLKVLVLDNCSENIFEVFILQLHLPLLEVLDIKCLKYIRIELYTPRLREFLMFGGNLGKYKRRVQFRHPESLRLIRTEDFYYDFEFANLEVLTCLRIKPNLDLSKLPKLKRIELYPIDHKSFKDSFSQTSWYRSLQTRRMLANRLNLEIRIFGFKKELFTLFEISHRINLNGFDDSFCFDGEYAQMVARHYPYLTDPLPYELYFRFSDFSKFFHQIPSDFFVYFPFIKKVVVN